MSKKNNRFKKFSEDSEYFANINNFPCPMCASWVYFPELRLDHMQTLKNAKVMNHDSCLNICKTELDKLPKEKFKLSANPNK